MKDQDLTERYMLRSVYAHIKFFLLKSVYARLGRQVEGFALRLISLITSDGVFLIFLRIICDIRAHLIL